MDPIHKIPIGIFSIFLFLSLWGCSGEHKDVIPTEISELENLTRIPADIEPIHDITLQKDKVIGDSEMNEGVLGRIGDIAVDDSGRIFIADLQQKTIHIFTPDGRLLKNLGRNGSGPSEFGHIFDMKIQGDRLFVFDPTLYRLNFYSLKSLTFDHVEGLFFQDWEDIQNIKEASPVKFYDWGDHNMLIGFNQIMGSSIYYYIVKNSNHRTKIISKPILIQQNDNQSWVEVEYHNGTTGSIDLPFGRKSLIAVTEDRHILSAWSDRFLIKKYDPQGTYLRAWYYPYNNLRLTQSDIDSYATSMGGAFAADIQKAINENEPPATWPALNDIIIDDQNQFWVSTIVKDMTVYQWWVLKSTGELMTRFIWPRSKEIKEIKNGYLYTRETEEETGLQQIVRYRIEMD